MPDSSQALNFAQTLERKSSQDSGRDRVQIGLGTKFRTGPLTFGFDYNVMAGMGGLQQGVRLTFSAPF
ncbi:hypothetical protein [Ralstonia sp. UBA689]|uniref:hypothetical protein n=1 Tax=Ralstonia sp. UBA689 TaxID=1947373 RepID=UPI0025E01DAE|nr:hypothetical protein [Ralstonia sp. UBA689]